ncbi:MAG: HEAT repeat domain-containing protein [Promethearchaeota archaeon]|nr:MAG: HEAT repeat domain-containing protein [Candidatus Lokiarchaeota archaeon]
MDLKKRERKKLSEKQQENPEISKIKDFMKDERFDDVVNIIALYLGDSTDENYLDRLEDIIETLMLLHGGRTVLRFLIERLVIDIPSLLENLSKRDSVLRYSFLLLLKSMCEDECDLFLPYSEDLLNSEDPNVREAVLQLLVFIAGGEKSIEDESLIKAITDSLSDEKDFVVKKAIQALIAIGRDKPSLVTKIITNNVKEIPENKELKESTDKILRSIVSVEGIEEIVEEEDLEEEEVEISEKELELKKKKIAIQKKKLELQEKEKQLEEQFIQEKEKALKLKEDMIDHEIEKPLKKEDMELPKKIKKIMKKEESDILDKELELKKKDLEIKKKKLELELREKEIEQKAIEKKEEALRIKEELIEKENELSRVELELKERKIKEKEQKLLEGELERAEEFFEEEDEENNEEKKLS